MGCKGRVVHPSDIHQSWHPEAHGTQRVKLTFDIDILALNALLRGSLRQNSVLMGGDGRDVDCEGLTTNTSLMPTHATLVLSGLYRPQGPHYGLGWGSPILAITLSLSGVHCGDQLY
jgi:hypothetical protein